MDNRFELPSELNIYSAQALRDALLAWVAQQADPSGDILEISARAVVEVDGAGLQLLAALGQGGPAWRLVEASAVFSEACRTLGLGHWLDSGGLTPCAGEA